MTDGIGRIFGGNSYGVGGYVPQRKDESVEEQNKNQAQPQRNFEETQVDPNKVMDFLASNNFFVPAAVESAPVSEVNGVDAGAQDRIAGYMESFEKMFAIVEEEFGPELAPQAFDVAMDKLLGMA